jgi:hypothetical protein
MAPNRIVCHGDGGGSFPSVISSFETGMVKYFSAGGSAAMAPPVDKNR